MKFSPGQLDEIRERIILSALVAETTPLKRAGREMRGLSPFNAEKTPSFYVNDQKQFYHCFSSGKHGDCFTWLMEIRGLSFPEAVEELANRAGVKITREEAGQIGSRQRNEREAALAALVAAQEIFQEELRSHGPARSYLAGRGIDAAHVDAFGIGFAPNDRYAVGNRLRKRGIDVGCMVAAGLLIDQDVAAPYSFFRGRITFPIRGRRGAIASFGGRAFGQDGSDAPKYLNGRDTFLYDKSRALYGIDRAHAAIAKAGHAVLVEGYTDVIQAQAAAGIENTVGTCGTAVTAEQLHTLWKTAPLVVICLDGDGAGERAADRTIDTVLPYLAADRRVAFVNLPAGADPDAMIRSAGPEAFAAAVRNQEPFVERLWSKLRKETPGDAPEDRSRLEASVREMTGLIADARVSMGYRDDLLDRVKGVGKRYYRAPVVSRTESGIPPREAALVYAAAVHPGYLDASVEAFSRLSMSTPLTAALQSRLLDCVGAGAPLDVDSVSRDLAVLRASLPSPEPSFIEREEPTAFMETLAIQQSQAARRRLRSER